jgi:hypothetical protein
LFPFTLTGRAKDWLLSLPTGTIQTWDELELKFLEKYFPMAKYLDKKQEISNFRQGESESLCDAWKKKIKGEKSEKLIDEDSILRKSKSQILKDGDKQQVIPSYVKLPYPHLAKKKKKEEGQFKKFMQLFSQL